MSTPVGPESFDEVQALEEDEDVPPRPEEEVADVLRSEPQRRTNLPD